MRSPSRSTGRERKDIVSGQIMPERALIRLAISPDGQIIPDPGAKLPGRGVWVQATAQAVEIAVAKGHIARSAKQKVRLPDNLPELIAQVLRQRLIGLMGMARRSGQIVCGFENCKSALQSQAPAFRIAAADSSRDGRNKLRVIAKANWEANPVLGLLTAEEIGGALGQEAMTHAVVLDGKMGRVFSALALKLSGFIPLIPAEWEEEIADFHLWKSAQNPTVAAPDKGAA